MNLSQFLDHWKLTENPFRGEEARTDSVFARVALRQPTIAGQPTIVPTPAAAPPPLPSGNPSTTHDYPVHSDFEKIVGDLARPSTAIVFGEKGSGKTAIRLQLQDLVDLHNAKNVGQKTLLIAYDDLNGVLDRLHRRVDQKTPLDSFKKIRLADHIDAILGLIVPRMIDTLLFKPSAGINATGAASFQPGPDALNLGPEPRKLARKLDDSLKSDVLLLQAIYDRADGAPSRTSRLRSLLRKRLPTPVLVWSALVIVGWIPAAAVLFWHLTGEGETFVWNTKTILAAVLLGLWLIALIKRLAFDRVRNLALGHRLRKQIRVQARSDSSYAASLDQLDGELKDSPAMPIAGTIEGADESRYTLLDRLRRVLRAFGYSGLIVVIDRVDEPTLIAGDSEKMRAVIWPMLTSKFLQNQGFGIKMLLPIELRHALFKESAGFFQEARLDKQNLVERLTWTGAMLYDLCDARLKACRAPGESPISLMDLFEAEVQTKDVVDALDQMHQPRDAFKFLYACIHEHCSNVTADQNAWKLSRQTLEFVRKQQSDRVQQLYRGIRPA